MEKITLKFSRLDEARQIKELLYRLGFGIMLKGSKYMLLSVQLTRGGETLLLQEIAAQSGKPISAIESAIDLALKKAWGTHSEYWPILFKTQNLQKCPTYFELVNMIVQWMLQNEVVYLSCPERPLHSYTELRTKEGDFIAK